MALAVSPSRDNSRIDPKPRCDRRYNMAISTRSNRQVAPHTASALPLTALAVLWPLACMERPIQEQDPLTNNLFVDAVNLDRVEKLDLLFMIDNSASMADKQGLLAEAVPKLLERLMNPPCLVKETGEVVPVESPDSPCPRGEREFAPIKDAHVGVITSSLGTMGSKACGVNDATAARYANDKAHLVGTVRPDPPASYQDLGFLAWDNRSLPNEDPSLLRDLGALQSSFASLVTLAGENGCGYEASLESWYRFLIDPHPPSSYTIGEKGRVERGPDDEVLLQQRQAFLRSDSLVAILMLTDENDCSMRADGFGWLVGAMKGDYLTRPPNPTTACDTSGPNDPCCTSCGLKGPLPAHCTPVAEDPNCAADKKPIEDDASNARCWDQKRRFGLDLLYPTSRYEVALKSPKLCPDSTFGDADCSCTRAKELGVPCQPGLEVQNPLYQEHADGLSRRDPSLVFLAGIVGVPWQDIATPETRDPNHPDLQYLTAEQLAAPVPGANFTYWDLILGDPSRGLLPMDPYMVESPAPRLHLPPHPLVEAPMAAAHATNARASSINGHEWNAPHDATHFDLQYACTFPLPERMTEDCGDGAHRTGCDCSPNPNAEDPLALIRASSKPLCQDPASGEYGTVQRYAKAYPGLRQLEVLKRAGSQAIVASICPKSLDDGPSYGYNPAVDALVDRLKIRLGDKCLPRRLAPDPSTGRVACRVIEAVPPQRCASALPLPGRIALEEGNAVGEIRRALEARGQCDVEGTSSCIDWCYFEIEQLAGQGAGEPLHSCQNGVDTGLGESTAGYCYVDPEKGVGSAELVDGCPETQRRLLRFVGNDTPRGGAITFYACAGTTTR